MFSNNNFWGKKKEISIFLLLLLLKGSNELGFKIVNVFYSEMFKEGER